VFELVPLAAGVLIGLRAARTRRGGEAAVLVVLAGVSASWIAGELSESWAFVLLDVAEVALAAIAAMSIVVLGSRLATTR
jgi:hypothetical protein